MQTRTVRSLVRPVIATVVATFALVPLASVAFAVSDGVCVFNVVPNPVTSFPAQVHIEGTAPPGATVTAFSGATPLVSAVADAGGNFTSAPFALNAPTDVTANFVLENGNGYATGCSDPSGSTVVRVLSSGAVQQTRQPTAFTGSNSTPFVMIGVAAVVVGAVLTVGARRRSRLSA